jgi:hypothetical protein
MKAMRLMLALGTALLLMPVSGEAKSRFYNGISQEVVVFYKAQGCAGIHNVGLSCTSATIWEDYVCKKEKVQPGDETSYGFKALTSDRDLVVYWCATGNSFYDTVKNTGNSGPRSRCAAVLEGSEVKVRCDYPSSDYPPVLH